MSPARVWCGFGSDVLRALSPALLTTLRLLLLLLLAGVGRCVHVCMHACMYVFFPSCFVFSLRRYATVDGGYANAASGAYVGVVRCVHCACQRE